MKSLKDYLLESSETSSLHDRIMEAMAGEGYGDDLFKKMADNISDEDKEKLKQVCVDDKGEFIDDVNKIYDLCKELEDDGIEVLYNIVVSCLEGINKDAADFAKAYKMQLDKGKPIKEKCNLITKMIMGMYLKGKLKF